MPFWGWGKSTAFVDFFRTWILEVVNASLREGRVPAPLKEVVVQPVLKKASLDPEVAANYRPVANVPFLGKVLERVVAGQLQALLDETDYLDPFQPGFRPSYGTESALVALYDDLCRERDRGSASLLVLLDLSAAFDAIDHGILLDRLAGLGVGGTALQWFRSYLNGRFQKVVLGDYDSAPWQLYPLLFNVYMKRLGEVIRRCGLRNHQYTDDTQLYLSFSTNPGEAVAVLNWCLAELHWLPIEVRAQFKVLVMTYKALNGLGPGYLKERLRPYMPTCPLRSAAEALLWEPSVKEIRRFEAFGKKDFLSAGTHIRTYSFPHKQLPLSPSLKIWKWKQGQATKEEYKQIARDCRNCIRKAKAENELRIARDAKHNKKVFFRYIQNKRHEKEKGVQLLKVEGRVVTAGKEKAEALNSYLASVFSHKEICNQEEVQAGCKRWQPKIDRQMVKEYLGGINTFKSPGPNELHPRIIKELAEELSEPLASIKIIPR
ncbi:LINE-1 retrotransposable element ORF2 protein [Varanus komodoensis]|nr:LINE-1 retrotransposable element ORF2 protein [Varanus komodoensis]